jgi:adenylate cyclase
MMQTRRRLAAIMFTDMVGYSALAQVDEAHALDVLDRHNRLLRPIFKKFSGREVKTFGDAFLVEFESALDSARCAIEIQRVLHEYNRASPASGPIRIRVGIHVGDVVHAAGDVFGDVVNIASRIQSVADPESVCVTQQVYDQVQNKVSTSFVKMPHVALKNITAEVSIYRVVPAWDPPTPVIRVPEPAGTRSLAVLPLANISPDPSDEYFADGLTEELISVLSRVRDLSVIARTSVLAYKTAPKSVAEVGRELGVDAVLEGSVRKAGARIRITLQLIDVPTQRHLWSSSYDREVDDVFAVQADIAARTAEALQLEFVKTGRSRATEQPTKNSEAYDWYLRGLVAGREPMWRGYDEAIRCYERATQLDPEFAEAYAAWADMYVAAAGDHVSMREVIPHARELTSKALRLDPNSSEAHAALANLSFQYDHDWSLAEREFRTALSLNPSNVTAHRFFGMMLVALGRFEEAGDVFRAEVRLDPTGHSGHPLVIAEAAAGNHAAEVHHREEELKLHPTSVSHHVQLGFAYLAAGRRADALKEANTSLKGADGDERYDHALLNALLGRPKEARGVASAAAQGEAGAYISGIHLAMLYAALGEREKALGLLEEDARDGDRVLWLLFRGVWFDSIRDDPRFVALLRQYGLPLEKRPAPPRKRARGSSGTKP